MRYLVAQGVRDENMDRKGVFLCQLAWELQLCEGSGPRDQTHNHS